MLNGASKLANSFDKGFYEITKKPEFREYFHSPIDSNTEESLRRELLGYTAYAIAILVGENGYIRDPEGLQLFMEEFISQTGRWDEALYGRVDRYRELDAERGDPLGTASGIEFARLASIALLGKESEGGETLLGLINLGALFLVNYISPALSEAFYTPDEEEELAGS